MTVSRPPTVATWLMKRLGTNQALMGDLSEEYQQGRSRAWFWRQALMAILLGWLGKTLQKRTNMASSMLALRWFAALPLAILAADAAVRILGLFMPKDFHHLGIWVDVALFSMAAAFVSVGVWVAPSRKDSVARIAVSVVTFCSALFMAWGALSMATTPLFWGVCSLLGGVVAYLPWRRHEPSQVLET